MNPIIVLSVAELHLFYHYFVICLFNYIFVSTEPITITARKMMILLRFSVEQCVSKYDNH